MSADLALTRRQFLGQAARLAAAGGIAAGISLLVLQKASADCPKPINCQDCSVFGNCDLAKAATARKAPSSSANPPAVTERTPDGRK